jgi:sugar phosphate isomerase/epimerase
MDDDQSVSRRSVLSAALGASAAMAAGPLLAADGGGPQGADGKFKIGVCDWMTGKGGSPEVLKWAATIALDGVQVSFGAPGDKFDLRKPENRDLYARTAKEAGLRIASLGMGVLNNVPYKSDPRTEEWVSDSLDVAKAMGLTVVLLAFFAKGDLKNDKEGTAEVIRRLKHVAPRAQKAGVYLGIESWLSAEEHVHILDAVGSPHVQVYYDVGNSFKMGYDIYREIRWLGGKRICEFHAKDYAAKGFGNGDIDFKQVRQAMDAIGYRGWFHLEGPTQPWGLDKTYRHDRDYLKTVFPAEG